MLLISGSSPKDLAQDDAILTRTTTTTTEYELPIPTPDPANDDGPALRNHTSSGVQSDLDWRDIIYNFESSLLLLPEVIHNNAYFNQLCSFVDMEDNDIKMPRRMPEILVKMLEALRDALKRDDGIPGDLRRLEHVKAALLKLKQKKEEPDSQEDHMHTLALEKDDGRIERVQAAHPELEQKKKRSREPGRPYARSTKHHRT